jgi:hypothetical protein
LYAVICADFFWRFFAQCIKMSEQRRKNGESEEENQEERK